MAITPPEGTGEKEIMPTKTLDCSHRFAPFAGLRRSCLYQPLAILLAILLAPAASWMIPGGSSTAPFKAQAQQVLSCGGGTTNTIIQKFCTANNSPSQYAADLVQLEQDAVNGYLAFHGIPVNDPS